MGKNVAVFVDVANIFYAAKAAGVDIDYVTLLKSATAGRDFVRAYAYTGLDPDNENQRNFHQFLARNQYKVVSKDIRKYGDGKVKANLDIELVVDLMKTARNLDVAVIVSGDGDFASAIRAVQEMGVRVEVISFRGNTSSDLIEAADLFTDITHIAKVDKGSTRSGRRVAGDDEDLSMTEVPEKQSEGTGRGRGRGRGRGGRYERDEAPAATRAARGRPEVPAAPMGGAGLVALPGEKLSRAVASVEGVEDVEAPEALDELEEGVIIEGEAVEGEADGEGRRRRRRRGGRGRGRGRRDELTPEELAEGVAVDAEGEVVEAIEAPGDAEADAEEGSEPAAAPARARSDRGRAERTPSGDYATPFDDLDALAKPRAPRSTPFGSVWDQQLGAPARPAASGLAPLPEDEEDLEEPEIPEYLLAERRGQGGRGGGNRGGGGRGGRNAAYAAAIERERYGGGRGSTGSGINRYGESRGGAGAGSAGGGGRSGGGRSGGGSQPSRGPRQDRPAERYDRAPRSAGTSAEPWSEVPPELEELLLAQMAKSTPAGRPSTASAEAPVQEAAPRRRTTRKPAAAEAPLAVAEAPAEAVADEAPAAPKRRTTRKPAAAASTAEAPAALAGRGPRGPEAIVPDQGRSGHDGRVSRRARRRGGPRGPEAPDDAQARGRDRPRGRSRGSDRDRRPEEADDEPQARRRLRGLIPSHQGSPAWTAS